MLTLTSILLISGCGLSLPAEPLPPTATVTQTATPTPTIDWFPATPTPTFIPIASPTPQPTREGEIEGIAELLVEDDFSAETLWETRQSNSGNIAFGTQNLSIAIASQSTSLFSISQHTLPVNFALEVTVQPSFCEPEDQVGIIFWHQSDSDYYRLLVNCAGQIRLELVQGGQNFVLHDWEQAAQMQPSAPASNQFILWVHKGIFRLFINETFQFEESIAQDRSGALGLFAKTISSNGMTVRFSDLKIYRVELTD